MFTYREQAMRVNIGDRTWDAAAALRTVERHGGVVLSSSPRASAGPRRDQGLVRLGLPTGRTLTVGVKTRSSLRPSHLPQLREELRTLCTEHECDGALVLSPYVPRPLAEKLREEGIWFADTAGNVYLEVPGEVLVYVTGERPADPALPTPPWPSAAAAKVLFRLLVLGPEFRATCRDLAQDAEVSLGLVSRTLTALVSQGILDRRGRAVYRVADGRTLLDLWCEAYALKLRPKLFRGRFRGRWGTDFSLLLRAVAKERTLRGVVIGGELAADLLGGHLRAGSVNLYVPEGAIQDLAPALGLAPSQEGNVEIYASFAADLGATRRGERFLLGHPVLVYAELLATGEARCGEAALRLREQYMPWAQ